ncbi:hypothetical protein CTI12_AA047230 [Artemisia annua]|uniref:Uncharacterized protein n=1 Tax=Artemisia annua TaxID=35608 RepID=A0A2U1QCM9_ARTAN|nr:hypothetical protein CTI12_AA047230 [Artemisia annua]
MASEEAKAKWLRMANRCIVAEDYVRESRPSSFIPSSSKSESEKSLYDLPADTRWWLNQQHKVDVGSFCIPRQETFADYVGIHELKDVIGDTLQRKTKLPESWTEEDELVAFSDEPEKLFSELESQWIGVKKNVPWWRATDLDDLASFVSHKSLQHFDNCDLPLPKTNKTGLLVASSPQESDKENSSFSSITGSLTSQYTPGIVGCSPDTPFSTKQANNMETTNSEFSNAQLLEALSHSQRRAREAERAAQQAYNEKENVISLFLKQASQIWRHFACSLGVASISPYAPGFLIL